MKAIKFDQIEKKLNSLTQQTCYLSSISVDEEQLTKSINLDHFKDTGRNKFLRNVR